MRVFVAGSQGFLAEPVISLLKGRHDYAGMDILDNPPGDVTKSEDVRSRLQDFRPDVILHLAAWTAVDACEDKSKLAFRIHEEGSRVVAEESNRVGAHVFGISTDYVFDGIKKQPYREEDLPNPLSVYGRSKLAGEKALQKAKQWTIVRSAWFYGPSRRNFVDTILEAMDTHGGVRVVNDQVGSPTYTFDLAEGLMKLVEARVQGLYHLANSGEASWFDLAHEAARLSGRPPERVAPVTTKDFPRLAPRPPYSVLDCDLVAKQHGIRLRPWKEALAEYIAMRPKETSGDAR